MNNTSNIGENTGIGNNSGGTPINIGPSPVGVPPITQSPTQVQSIVDNPVAPVNIAPAPSVAPIQAGVVSNPAISSVPVTQAPVTPAPAPVTPVTPVSVAPSVTPAAPVAIAPTVAPVSVQPTVAPAPVSPEPAPVQQPVIPMIPNVDDLIASAPIVSSTPTTETKSVEVNAVSSEPQVELNMSSNIKIEANPTKEKKKKESETKNNSDDEEGEIVHSNKAPIVMAVIFVTILVLIFVYYYIIMTPQKVFDKAIDTTFDYVKEMITGVEKANKKFVFELGFAIHTDNDQFQEEIKKGWQKPTDYITDDYLKGTIYFDTTNEDARINLKSFKRLENFKNITYNGKPVMDENGNISDSKLKDMIEKGKQSIKSKNINSKDEYTKMLDFNFYSVGVEEENENGKKELQHKLFIGPIQYVNYNDLESYKDDPEGVQLLNVNNVIADMDDSIKDKLSGIISLDNSSTDPKMKTFVEEFNKNGGLSLTYETINALVNIAEITKDKVVDIIQNDELSRSLAIKKVGDTTTIALKAHSLVNHERIAEIYKEGFKDFYDNKNNKLNGKDADILDEFSKVFGVDKEIIQKNLMAYLKDRDVVTDSVEVNLYMNLANTDLISLDVCIDKKYYVEISLLNGYYQFKIYTATAEEIENGKDVRDAGTKKVLDIEAVYDRSNGIVNGRGIIDNDNTYQVVTFDYERTVEEGKKVGNNLVLGFYTNDTYKFNDESKRKPYCLLRCDLTIFDSTNTDSVEDMEKTSFNLKEEVTYKSTDENDDRATVVSFGNITKKKNGYSGGDISNKFLGSFSGHVAYLFDHLLYNKIDAVHRNDGKTEKEKEPVDDKKDEEENKTTDENVTTEPTSDTKVEELEENTEKETTKESE